MATVRDHIDVQVILNTTALPSASFGVGLLLVDDVQIPADKRWIAVTSEDYDALDTGSDAFKYAQSYFAQKRTPQQLILGRSFEADSLPYWMSGPALDQDPASYAGIADASLNVDNGTLDEDFTAVLTGVTTFAQVIALFQAQFDAASTLTGLTISLDLFNRLQITDDASGGTVLVSDAASGTSLATLFDYADGASVPTAPEETLIASTQALQEQQVGFYNVNLRGSQSVDDLVDFASWVETQALLVDFVYSEVDAVSSGSSADLGSRLQALGVDRSMVIYTERTDYPDGAVNGCVLPGKEGTVSWSWEALKLVLDSGLLQPLSSTSRAVLKDKGYNWIETIEGSTILYDGITSGNEEKRVMLGKDWYEFTIQSQIFVRQLNVPLSSFDNETMGALEKIIRDVSDEAVERKIIIDTVAYPLVVSLPDADTIDQAQRDDHKFTELNAFSAKINSAINDYRIVGIWNG